MLPILSAKNELCPGENEDLVSCETVVGWLVLSPNRFSPLHQPCAFAILKPLNSPIETMSDPTTLSQLLDQLKATADAIQNHHEWDGANAKVLKVFDAVSGPILPVLHNYKWRELMLVEKANDILSQSPGVHGSDGKKAEEIESKSAKLKGRVLKDSDTIGMYDKIASRVDQEEALDASPLLDHFNAGPVREEAALKLIQSTPLQGKTGAMVVFSSPRRAKRLLKTLVDNNVLGHDKNGDLELGSTPWVSVDWPATLLSIGVARHEHSVFGLFGGQEKALLVVMCNSCDIEEVLGNMFEKRFDEYSGQMNAKRANANHGKATSARDAVKITVSEVLSLPSSKVIHLDTGALWGEKIKLDDALVEKIRKLPNTRTSNGVIKQQMERYITQFDAHEQSLKKAGAKKKM